MCWNILHCETTLIYHVRGIGKPSKSVFLFRGPVIQAGFTSLFQYSSGWWWWCNVWEIANLWAHKSESGLIALSSKSVTHPGEACKQFKRLRQDAVGWLRMASRVGGCRGLRRECHLNRVGIGYSYVRGKNKQDGKSQSQVHYHHSSREGLQQIYIPSTMCNVTKFVKTNKISK